MKKAILPIIGILTSTSVVGITNNTTPQEKIRNNNKEMKNIKENVEQEIIDLREKKYSCSQATLLGLSRVFGSKFNEKDLLAISAGFRGGIGRTFNEGTCGALSVGVIALGIYLPDDNEKATALSKELFDHFKNEQGTVICGNIVGEHGFDRCTGCCLCVGDKVVELLEREKVDFTSAKTFNWKDVEHLNNN